MVCGFVILREGDDEEEVWICNPNASGGTTTNTSVNKMSLPSSLESSGIKEIFSTRWAIYFLSNDNTLYATAAYGRYIGMDSGTTTIVEIDSPTFETLYPDSNKISQVDSSRTWFCTDAILFEGVDGKIYTIGNSTIMYLNDILQTSWTLIASNVDSVALGSDNSIAYVEKDSSNLYVAGEDSRMLGVGSEIQTKISNFTLVDTSYLDGDIVEVQFSYKQMHVLTSEGTLYTTGLWSSDGTSGTNTFLYPGWEEQENYYTFVKILEDVTNFSVSQFDKIAVSNNQIYTWGRNYRGNLGQKTVVPTVLDLSSSLDMSNIKKLYTSHHIQEILLNDGTLFVRAMANTGFSGSETVSVSMFVGGGLYDISDEYNGEAIIDVAVYSAYATYQLTSEGNLYGWGAELYLGIGSSSSSAIRTVTQLSVSDEKIVSITCGSGFAIAITETGKVYGTGSNTYGVLGRWIGVGRGTSNSRYKTAFNWVECPELEI